MFQYYKYNRINILNMKSNRYYMVVILITLFLIFLILFCNYYKVTIYFESKLVVNCQENECKYYIYVPLDKIATINDSKVIKINKDNYPYQINNIEEIAYDEKNLINYQIVQININLKKDYQINNLVIDIKILEKEEKLINLIKNILLEE